MTDRIDSLVADYLARVSRATAGLAADRRDELVRDLREHIETSRADLPAETEAEVRGILERLGDPAVIARAAAEEDGLAPVQGCRTSGWTSPASPPAGRHRRGNHRGAGVARGSALFHAGQRGRFRNGFACGRFLFQNGVKTIQSGPSLKSCSLWSLIGAVLRSC